MRCGWATGRTIHQTGSPNPEEVAAVILRLATTMSFVNGLLAVRGFGSRVAILTGYQAYDLHH
jgi:hypothetical protein